MGVIENVNHEGTAGYQLNLDLNVTFRFEFWFNGQQVNRVGNGQDIRGSGSGSGLNNADNFFKGNYPADPHEPFSFTRKVKASEWHIVGHHMNNAPGEGDPTIYGSSAKSFHLAPDGRQVTLEWETAADVYKKLVITAVS